MQAEIIAIGDELLIGQTIDTNSAFIAAQLNLIGISVKQKRSIADDEVTIKDALDEVFPETRLVFMTGGLGPTSDDITKKTLNDYFGGKLVFHEDIFRNIQGLFRSFNREPKEVHRQQAFLPDVCRILKNDMGTASGMHFQKGDTHFFSLPGVPYETEHLVHDRIVPWLRENIQQGTVVHRTLLTQGVPESELAERLARFENDLPADISIAYLPSPGMVRIRLSSYTGAVSETTQRVESLANEARQLLGDIVYGEGTQKLEEIVGQMLRQRGLSLGTAESCTGGNIASLITSVAGSSDYFKGSIVSYATEVKIKVLEVEKQAVERSGVVSQQVAEQMAAGAKKHLQCDFAIATTGVAGPGGGDSHIPVGTVWISIAGPQRTWSKQFRFGRNRERNIRISSITALNMLRKELQKIET